MDVSKIIVLFYFIYTGYTVLVVNTTNIGFFEILPAVIMLWINYYAFKKGYSFLKDVQIKNPVNAEPWLLRQKINTRYYVAIVSIVFSATAIFYYTGQSPLRVLYNVSHNISTYAQYQKFFAENQRHIFSILKLPFVFMMFYIKIVLFYSYIVIFLVKSKVNRCDIYYISLITFSHIYFGISRGTNFEFFELVLLIIFVLLSKFRSKNKKWISLKMLGSIFILISVMIIIYYGVLKTRGINSSYFTSRDDFYDSQGIVPKFIPFLSFIILILYDYFGFGFYYIATFISKVWFSSGTSVLAGLLPLGFKNILHKDLVTIMSKTVSMGTRWHPDQITIINNFGYIGLILFCFILGIIVKYVQVNGKNSVLTYMTLFMIFLQMLSLPIGNFVSVSSSSKLIITAIVINWILKKNGLNDTIALKVNKIKIYFINLYAAKHKK